MIPDLSIRLRWELDDLCDRFEADWNTGASPSLEDYLARWPANEHRETLFRHLLELDLDYRKRRKSSYSQAAYQARFPELASVVQAVFQATEETDRTQSFHTRKARLPETNRTPPASPPGYEILDTLGRGGMGVVYKARQLRLNRLVALKMLLAGELASSEEALRFQAEAEAAAKLDHPNIVPIYEVGEHQGRLFFSMALVEGMSLSQRFREEPFTIREAVELVRTIAQGVSHAHEQGVIHRDLKPANILLGTDGRPRISDFGLAKQSDAAAELTTTGQILGTPSYMAPEQAAGRIHEITPRTDVYALGAILYEALVGRPPFRDANAWETIRQVIHNDPVSPRLLNPRIVRDLETIVLKSLEKTPTARYASALDFADDLGRFLRDEPIRARRVSRVEKIVRWARKHRAIAALAAALTVLIAVGSIGATIAWSVFAWQERTRTALAKDKTRLVEQTQTLHKKSRAERYVSDMIHAGEALRLPTGIGRVRDFVDPWADDSETPNLRGWEWHFLRSAAHEEYHFIQIATPERVPVPLTVAAFHPRREFIAFGASTGEVFVSPIEDQSRMQHSLDQKRHVSSLVWKPDGSQFATASLDGEVIFWESEPLRKIDELRFPQAVFAIAWHPDGRSLAVHPQSDGIHVIDLTTKERTEHLNDRLARQGTMAFSPTGDRLAVVGENVPAEVSVLIYSTKDWKLLHELPGHTQQINRIVWSRNGERIAAASFDRTVKLWETREGKLLASFDSHDAQATSVVFADQDRELVSAGWDYAGRRFDIAAGKQSHVLRGHTKRVNWCDIDTAGELLATASDDGTLRFWDLKEPPSLIEIKEGPRCLDDPYPMISWRHDGREFVACNDSFSRFFKANSSAPYASRSGALPQWSFNDSYFASWEVDRLNVSKPGDSQRVKTFDSPRPGFGRSRSRWANRSERLLVSDGTSLYVWDMNDPAPREFVTGLNNVKEVAWNYDDSRVLVACVDGFVKMFNVNDGAEILSFKPHSGSSADHVSWHPAGKRFITCGPDRTAVVWNLAGEKLAVLAEHSFTVHQAEWNPEGSRIATAGGDGTVRIWNPEGEQTFVIQHADQVLSVAWSPDGHKLVSLSQDGTILIHDAARSYEYEADNGANPDP